MKALIRLGCLLTFSGLLGACGGGGGDAAAANTPPAAVDTTLTLDVSTWDATDWAE